MAAQESDSKPREAAMISLIPTAVTIFVSIVVTSYIASYGVEVGTLALLNTDGTAADTVTRLGGYFNTAEHVVGIFGLVVLSTFTVLSALTTILGSFYYTTKLFKNNSANKSIFFFRSIALSRESLLFSGNTSKISFIIIFFLSSSSILLKKFVSS